MCQTSLRIWARAQIAAISGVSFVLKKIGESCTKLIYRPKPDANLCPFSDHHGVSTAGKIDSECCKWKVTRARLRADWARYALCEVRSVRQFKCIKKMKDFFQCNKMSNLTENCILFAVLPNQLRLKRQTEGKHAVNNRKKFNSDRSPHHKSTTSRGSDLSGWLYC